jgi:hypothetical protein
MLMCCNETKQEKTMRRVSFALVLTALVLSFGLANASCPMTSTISGGVWMDGMVQKLNPNTPFTVTISYANSSDDPNLPERITWSMPIRFHGTDQVTTMVSVADTTGWLDATFVSQFDMLQAGYLESWDGDLTNGACANNGSVNGDFYNFSGVANNEGIQPGESGVMVVANFTGVAITDPALYTDYGDFCISQGDMCNDDYDWLFDDPPDPVLTQLCIPVEKQPNENAAIDCDGADNSGQWHSNIIVPLTATEVEDDLPYTWTIVDDGGVSGTVGVVAGDPTTSATLTFSPDCADVGSKAVTVGVADAAHQGEFTTCVVNFTVLNSPPTLIGPCGQTFKVGTDNGGVVIATFSATDPNTGDPLVYSVSGTTMASIDGAGNLTFTSDNVEASYTVNVMVTDCAGATDDCDIIVEVTNYFPYDIVIEKDEGDESTNFQGALQGHHAYVDVTKEAGSEAMFGFDFLIGYDASALTFIKAIPGILFDMVVGDPPVPGPYQWEYFTYRYNWNGNCGNACPSGLLRVVGIADQNDGAHHPVTGFIPDGTVLFTLDFLVSNDRTYECMYVPIYWYWMDCGDNTIAYNDVNSGDPLEIWTAMADEVYIYDGTTLPTGEPYGGMEVSDQFTAFPSMFGIADYCLEGVPLKPPPNGFIRFFGGGVDIICADSIDARGDINLNGVANEIADAVVFTNYFIHGFAAFTINVEGQIAATEVNGDGIVLSVADLVYLIRVIVGDALPLPKVAPNLEAHVVATDVVNIDAEIGAVAMTFAGNANITLAEGAIGMEIKSHFDGTNTNVIVYSFAQGMTASGDIVNTDADLIKVEAADYNGNAYKTVVLPASFELTQNAPNPFNPATVVSASLPIASDYTLTVYNVAGQKVMDLSGYSEAGQVVFNLDLSNHASGIYFYKFEAGSFSATKKMVLLK